MYKYKYIENPAPVVSKLKEDKDPQGLTTDKILVYIFGGLTILGCVVCLFLICRRFIYLLALDEKDTTFQDWLLCAVGVTWFQWQNAHMILSIVFASIDDKKYWDQIDSYFIVCLWINSAINGLLIAGLLAFIFADYDTIFVKFVKTYLILLLILVLGLYILFLLSQIFMLQVLKYWKPVHVCGKRRNVVKYQYVEMQPIIIQ
jgi:hypothetical protein